MTPPGSRGHGLGKLKRSEIGHTTWAASQSIEPYQGGRGRRGWRNRPRLVDYALTPEPTLTGELLRRSFLEGA